MVESGTKWKNMFFGSYEYNIDEKGRVVIPSKMREAVGTKLFLIKGFEGCISLYKEEEFQKYINRIQSLPYEVSKVRKYSRLLLASVVELSIDRQGRMLIPTKTLKEYHIGTKAVILGQNDHIEIWDLDGWNSYKEESEKDFELDAESLLVSDEK